MAKFKINDIGIMGAVTTVRVKFDQVRRKAHEIKREQNLSSSDMEELDNFLSKTHLGFEQEASEIVTILRELDQKIQTVDDNLELSGEGKVNRKQTLMKETLDILDQRARAKDFDGQITQLSRGMPLPPYDHDNAVVGYLKQTAIRERFATFNYPERYQMFISACETDGNPLLIAAVENQLPEPFEPLINLEHIEEGRDKRRWKRYSLSLLKIDALEILREQHALMILRAEKEAKQFVPPEVQIHQELRRNLR